MKFLFNSLLLVTWLTLQMCQEYEDKDDSDSFNIFRHFHGDLDGLHDSEEVSDVPVSPNIKVYQQVEDREHFIVMCTDEMWSNRWWSAPELSVQTQSDNNYTLEMFNLQNKVKYYSEVTQSPPVSFTCVQNNNFRGNITKLHSETYTFNQSGYPTIQVNKISVSDQVEEGVSSFYIGFVSFIAVGLFIMTAAVIVTTSKSKTKESTMRATNNDYEDA